MIKLPKKIKSSKEKVEIKSPKECDPVLIRDEEKSAVSIGLVFGIAYLLIGMLVTVSPTTAAMVLKSFTFGLVEVTPKEVDSKMLLIGLVSALMMGVVGGFFYAKIYNMIKKA